MSLSFSIIVPGFLPLHLVSAAASPDSLHDNSGLPRDRKWKLLILEARTRPGRASLLLYPIDRAVKEQLRFQGLKDRFYLPVGKWHVHTGREVMEMAIFGNKLLEAPLVELGRIWSLG